MPDAHLTAGPEATSVIVPAFNEGQSISHLVAELKAYKEAHGISFLDPDRERELLRALQESNPGPLSEEGLRDLVEHVLALTKRELG